MTRRVYGRVLYDGLGNPVGIAPFIAAALPLLKGAAAALIPKVIGTVARAAQRRPAAAAPAPAPSVIPAGPAIATAAPLYQPVAPPFAQPTVMQTTVSPGMTTFPPYGVPYVRPVISPMGPYGAAAPGMFPLVSLRRRRIRRVIVRRA